MLTQRVTPLRRLGSGGTAPRILILGTKWSQLVYHNLFQRYRILDNFKLTYEGKCPRKCVGLMTHFCQKPLDKHINLFIIVIS